MNNPYFILIKKSLSELALSTNDAMGDPVPETVLLGEGSPLDSIDLINLIVSIENNIRTEYGRSISLVNERTMSSDETPFSTIASLTIYLEQILSENADG